MARSQEASKSRRTPMGTSRDHKKVNVNGACRGRREGDGNAQVDRRQSACRYGAGHGANQRKYFRWVWPSQTLVHSSLPFVVRAARCEHV
eukprot:572995-Pleurochrysis_carterae.AAC.1